MRSGSRERGDARIRSYGGEIEDQPGALRRRADAGRDDIGQIVLRMALRAAAGQQQERQEQRRVLRGPAARTPED